MLRPISINFKRNPVVIVRDFIILQLCGYAAFISLGMLADYGALYEWLSFSTLISYHWAHFLFVVVSELILTFFIFFQWFFTHYEITGDALIISRGVALHRKTSIPLDHIKQVEAVYGIVGKALGYGTLVIKIKSNESIRLRFISFPQKYSKLLMRARTIRERDTGTRFEVSDPEKLIGQEEGEHLEFKSTMRWDLRSASVNRGLEKMVMKTVAAFLNSGGGELVIGVDDKREIVGLDHDYKSLTRHGADGFETHFTHLFNSAIGADFRQFVKLRFMNMNNKEICIVQVVPAPKPVFIRMDNNEEFYVRTGNSTTPLSLSEAASYLDLWRRRMS